MQRHQVRRRLGRVTDTVGSALHGFRWIFYVAITAVAAGALGFAIGYWLGGG